MAAFIGCRRLQVPLRIHQVVQGGLHVRLIRNHCTQRCGGGRMIVTPVVCDAGVDFRNRRVDVPDGLYAMATFIAEGLLQLRAGLIQVGARRLHARLVGG